MLLRSRGSATIKILARLNYKERKYYVLMMFYRYSSSLKIKLTKVKDVDPAPSGSEGYIFDAIISKLFIFQKEVEQFFNQK